MAVINIGDVIGTCVVRRRYTERGDCAADLSQLMVMAADTILTGARGGNIQLLCGVLNEAARDLRKALNGATAETFFGTMVAIEELAWDWREHWKDANQVGDLSVMSVRQVSQCDRLLVVHWSDGSYRVTDHNGLAANANDIQCGYSLVPVEPPEKWEPWTAAQWGARIGDRFRQPGSDVRLQILEVVNAKHQRLGFAGEGNTCGIIVNFKRAFDPDVLVDEFGSRCGNKVK